MKDDKASLRVMDNLLTQWVPKDAAACLSMGLVKSERRKRYPWNAATYLKMGIN